MYNISFDCAVLHVLKLVHNSRTVYLHVVFCAVVARSRTLSSVSNLEDDDARTHSQQSTSSSHTDADLAHSSEFGDSQTITVRSRSPNLIPIFKQVRANFL